MLERPGSLLTILVALSAKAFCDAQTSTLSEERIQMQTRKQALGTSILAQLGFEEVPPKANITVPIPPEEKAKFDLLSQLVNFTEQERLPGSCQSTEYFAQTVSTFVGITNKYAGKFAYRSAEFADERARSVPIPSNLLNQVVIYFNFSLDPKLSLITQANLVLHQIPASDSDYIRDEEQYVEVKAIIPLHPGHSATMVIAGRFVNISEAGSVLFDITTAVEQWIAMEIQGELDLVISTRCFSSPLCAQPDDYKVPKSFMFVEAPPSGTNAPRIIVYSSTNPAERLNKRQAEVGGASFCIEGHDVQCCLVPFFINFVEDLGDTFAFIRDPVAYQANLCEGICPTSPGGQLMVPAVFNFLTSVQNNPASSLIPCCAGYTYGSLPVLLELGGILEARVFENAVLLSCTCS